MQGGIVPDAYRLRDGEEESDPSDIFFGFTPPTGDRGRTGADAVGSADVRDAGRMYGAAPGSGTKWINRKAATNRRQRSRSWEVGG